MIGRGTHNGDPDMPTQLMDAAHWLKIDEAVALEIDAGRCI